MAAPVPPPSSEFAPTVAPPADKAPRLTAKELEVLRLLSDGRVRKATTKTNPTTDEVNGTTAGALAAFGYVEAQHVPGVTMFKVTTKGIEFLRSYDDKAQMLAAKKAEPTQEQG